MQSSIVKQIKQSLLFYDVCCGFYCGLGAPTQAAGGRENFPAEYQAGTAAESAEANGLIHLMASAL